MLRSVANNSISSPASGRNAVPGPKQSLHARRRRGVGYVPYAFMAPAVITVTVMVIYPIVQVAVQSLFDVRPTMHEGWDFVGFVNYVKAMQDRQVWSVLGRSMVWTVGGVFVQFVVAMIGALLLQNIVGGRWLRAVFMLPWASPVVVGSLAWKLIYQQYGLVNQTVSYTHLTLPTNREV